MLPRDNEPDLDDLPAEVRERLTFHIAAELGEVLAIALRGASMHEGSLIFPEAGVPAPAGRFTGGPMLNRGA